MKVRSVFTLIVLGMIVLLVSAVCSCRTVQYVPVETVRTDSLYFNAVSTDSVYVKDSVLVVKGDTVTEYRWRYVYKYKDRTDTVYVSRTDSVQVPYPVEKELSRWQQFKMNVGGYALAAVVVTVLIVFGRMVYKLKK